MEKMEKLKAAVNAFDDYQHILKESQRYDFDDMINWVINVFQDHPDVLLTYQELYQYFLVDEYPDIVVAGELQHWILFGLVNKGGN